MSHSIGCNDFLSLFCNDYQNDERYEAERVPADNAITLHSRHEFLKPGYQVFPLGEPILLVVTEGNRKFTRVIGLIVIKGVYVYRDPFNDLLETQAWGSTYTSGSYRIVRVFNEQESAQWLEVLSPSKYIDTRRSAPEYPAATPRHLRT